MLASFSPVPTHDTMVRFFSVFRPMLDKDAQPHSDNRRLRIMMELYKRIQYISFSSADTVGRIAYRSLSRSVTVKLIRRAPFTPPESFLKSLWVRSRSQETG